MINNPSPTKPSDKAKEFEEDTRREVMKWHQETRYRSQRIWGTILLAIGVVFTLFQYLTTPAGQTFVYPIGFIIVGALLFINGWTGPRFHRK